MRLVVDTNVLLRGLAKPSSFSGQLLRACTLRAVPILLSKPIMDEYRAVLTNQHVKERYPVITDEAVEILLRKLKYVSNYSRRVSVRFIFSRDPRDEKLIELAIAGTASHLLSWDNDLLSLPNGRTDDSKRFRQRLPRIVVQSPEDFVKANRGLFE